MKDKTQTIIKPIILMGERIVLEPVSLLGLKDFHEYSMCPDFYEYLEYPPFKTIEESEIYLEELVERSKSSLQQFWFVKLSKYEKIIGSFGIHSLEEYRGSVEIGYGISPHYWGNGYFKEAAELVIEYIFHVLNLHRIVARTSALNLASMHGLERIGFLIEGTMRDYYRNADGQWNDAVLMAKLSSDK